MKKILTIMCITLSLFVIIGCTPQIKKVAILIYDESDTFMKEYLDEVIMHFDDKTVYDISYANRSQATQNRQFNEYIEQKYDLFIINAVDRLASQSLIDKSNQLNIPIIFINREPTDVLNNSKKAYYVGADSIGMGNLQAQMIYNDYLDQKVSDKNQDGMIQTFILKGEQGHQDAENRTMMVIQGLAELGVLIDVVEIKVANWDKQEAYHQIENLTVNIEDIELIISNNDDMALGAIDYMKTYKDNNNVNLSIPIYGVDATLLGIEAFEQGSLSGTIVNDYINQAILISKFVNYLLYDEKEANINYEKRFNYINGYIYQ